MTASPPDPLAPEVLEALPPALRTLAARGVPRRYRKGSLLIQEGELRDEQFIVLGGRVKAFSSDERDREIVYGVYGPGEYLGEMSLDGGPRSASVIAVEPTVCAMLTRHTLREHIAANPEFAFELIARVIRRARLATESARNMALIDVYGRVVALLNSLAVPQPDGTRVIAPKPTQQEIAARVGCERSMVARLVSDLKRGGTVHVEADRIVLDRPLPQRW